MAPAGVESAASPSAPARGIEAAATATAAAAAFAEAASTTTSAADRESRQAAAALRPLSGAGCSRYTAPDRADDDRGGHSDAERKAKEHPILQLLVLDVLFLDALILDVLILDVLILARTPKAAAPSIVLLARKRRVLI